MNQCKCGISMAIWRMNCQYGLILPEADTMLHDPKGRITLERSPHRVRVFAGDGLIADSSDAIELCEIGYPVRQYIPRQDIAMHYLRRSDKITHCPYKGDASYYSIVLADRVIENAAWSYEQPFAAMAGISQLIAFDARLVAEMLET